MFTIKPIFRILAVLCVIVSLIVSAQDVTPVYASDDGMATLSAVTWYVATTGSDSNACSDPGTACLTINAAIVKATAGDTIEVATGTYTSTGTEVVLINKAITLSGGWDAGFTTQSGFSTIDGETTRQGINSTGNPVIVDHFQVQNGVHANEGGGIYSYGGSLTLNNSIIHNNLSHWMGGGIFNYGTLTINNTTISDNTAGDPCCTGGGGGGGIENYSGTVTLNNSTMSNNTVIGVQGSAIDAGGTVKLNNSTISGNTGGGEGAIYTFVGTVILNNSTITNNDSYGFRSQAGHVSLQNTIIAGNGGSSDCSNDTSYNGTVTSLGYNLIGNSTGCTFTPTTGDLAGSSGSPIDAKLGPLQDNGGPTFTHALLGGSPALNAGNPATPGSGGSACLATDQRGTDRSSNAPCDIGAYEAVGPLVSITRADPNPTSVSQVNFTVTFSESVTGVDSAAPFSDFALTTTGVTGASIVAVSGSGDTYTVTVNTGLGDGTIRLDIVDDDTIQDSSGNFLGGTGTGNGNFTSGETYTISNTHIDSLVLASANPTAAATVDFTLTFNEAVTGIDTTAPFSDFALTTTGVTGASIAAVSGSGDTYTITVETGSGNGTIRLDVIDDDSIQDASGNPLGGTGAGNGNFTTGQTYTIKTISTPLLPAGTIVDATPTYKWTKIIGASKYQYQVFKGTKSVYTKIVDSSICGSTYCLSTPANTLINGAYKWHVRVMVGGIWKNYSTYKTFTVAVPPPPKAGFWSGDTDFYVTPDRKNITYYAMYFNVSACGIYNRKLVYTALIPIVNNHFNRNGSFYFNGTFSSVNINKGQVGLSSYYIPGCGYVSGGPFNTIDIWRNSNQPASVKLDDFILTTVVPDLNLPSIFYDLGLTKP